MQDISSVEIQNLLKLTMVDFNNSYSFTMLESEKTTKSISYLIKINF